MQWTELICLDPLMLEQQKIKGFANMALNMCAGGTDLTCQKGKKT